MVRPRLEGEQSQAYGTMLPRRVSIDEAREGLLFVLLLALSGFLLPPWYFYFLIFFLTFLVIIMGQGHTGVPWKKNVPR